MQRRWISVRECSSYLGLHLKTIYALISKGAIPAARIGSQKRGSIRVDRRKLDEQLENQILDLESKVKDWI